DPLPGSPDLRAGDALRGAGWRVQAAGAEGRATLPPGDRRGGAPLPPFAAPRLRGWGPDPHRLPADPPAGPLLPATSSRPGVDDLPLRGRRPGHRLGHLAPLRELPRAAGGPDGAPASGRGLSLPPARRPVPPRSVALDRGQHLPPLRRDPGAAELPAAGPHR